MSVFNGFDKLGIVETFGPIKFHLDQCIQDVISLTCHIYDVQKSHTKDKMDKLNPKIEKILEDIDSGKIKTARYKNAEEYLKHVDKVLSD